MEASVFYVNIFLNVCRSSGLPVRLSTSDRETSACCGWKTERWIYPVGFLEFSLSAFESLGDSFLDPDWPAVMLLFICARKLVRSLAMSIFTISDC